MKILKGNGEQYNHYRVKMKKTSMNKFNHNKDLATKTHRTGNDRHYFTNEVLIFHIPLILDTNISFYESRQTYLRSR